MLWVCYSAAVLVTALFQQNTIGMAVAAFMLLGMAAMIAYVMRNSK